MKRFGSIVAVVLIASGLAACSNRALGPGEARLKISSGKAQVAAVGEGFRNAHSDQRLHKGERVRVTEGLAEVQFSDSRNLELRSGSEVQVQATPELLAGDLLAVAKDTRFTVNAGNAEARVRRGAAHVTRGLAATAASYSGDLVISSAGRDLTVPALRQAAVPAPGLVPPAPTPLDDRPPYPRPGSCPQHRRRSTTRPRTRGTSASWAMPSNSATSCRPAARGSRHSSHPTRAARRAFTGS